MRTRIIAAFPGTGKSHYHQQHPDTTLDSDSSEFSWIFEDGKKVRNPDFPSNYIKHIKDNIGKYEFIFVSSHDVVREALNDACIFFYLVYPSYSRKKEFIKRYEERGSDANFVKLIENNWDDWIIDCSHTLGCEQVSMVLQNLTDEINHIIRSENGES